MILPRCVLLGCVCLIACAADNRLETEERNAGWILLFDGKTTEGWLEITGKPFPTSWTIEDGCLKAISNPEGFQDIKTTRSWRTFELDLDWKIQPKGNSGVKYFIQRVDEWTNKTGRQARARGFEYQLADDANEEVQNDPSRGAGSLYSVLPVIARVSPKIGEFNHTRLVVHQDTVEHWLNGIKVLEYRMNAPAVTALIQKLGQGAAHTLSSPISLQNHNSTVWFKNIKLLPLNR